MVLWRGARRALGQLLARPARSWTLGGKDNFVADQAVAGQVAAAYPDVLVAVRGRGSRARRLHVTVASSGIRSWYRASLPVGGVLPRSCLPRRRGPAWCPARSPGTAAGRGSRRRSPSPA